MSPKRPPATLAYLENYTSRKVERVSNRLVGTAPDRLTAWSERYLALAVVGVRSEEVAKKIALHLERFASFYKEAYGHERISAVLRRDVVAWQQALVDSGAGAGDGEQSSRQPLCLHHLGARPGAARCFPSAIRPRASASSGSRRSSHGRSPPTRCARSKSVCDRLSRFYQMKGRRWTKRRNGDGPPVRERARPLRDRAIVYVLLSTGLRREELVNLDLDQVVPTTGRGPEKGPPG